MSVSCHRACTSSLLSIIREERIHKMTQKLGIGAQFGGIFRSYLSPLQLLPLLSDRCFINLFYVDCSIPPLNLLASFTSRLNYEILMISSGKYFCHDVRVVRLPRHGASCPVGIGVSCSADRQVRTHSYIYIYMEV